MANEKAGASPSGKDWDQHYLDGAPPWHSGIRSRELARVLDEGRVLPCRVLELGCGAGTNAVYLAQMGFVVTAVDISLIALEQARQLAEDAGVKIEFIEADVCRWTPPHGPYEFVFDRGCYHCARKIDLPGFLKTLRSATMTGTKYLTLTGNANEQSEFGPPRLHEHEIRADLGELFDFEFIREIRFEDKGGVDGPLGWSCLMTRK
jgi:SAM-dependent methyltransferase